MLYIPPSSFYDFGRSVKSLQRRIKAIEPLPEPKQEPEPVVEEVSDVHTVPISPKRSKIADLRAKIKESQVGAAKRETREERKARMGQGKTKEDIKREKREGLEGRPKIETPLVLGPGGSAGIEQDPELQRGVRTDIDIGPALKRKQEPPLKLSAPEESKKALLKDIEKYVHKDAIEVAEVVQKRIYPKYVGADKEGEPALKGSRKLITSLEIPTPLGTMVFGVTYRHGKKDKRTGKYIVPPGWSFTEKVLSNRSNKKKWPELELDEFTNDPAIRDLMKQGKFDNISQVNQILREGNNYFDEDPDVSSRISVLGPDQIKAALQAHEINKENAKKLLDGYLKWENRYNIAKRISSGGGEAKPKSINYMSYSDRKFFLQRLKELFNNDEYVSKIWRKLVYGAIGTDLEKEYTSDDPWSDSDEKKFADSFKR